MGKSTPTVDTAAVEAQKEVEAIAPDDGSAARIAALEAQLAALTELVTAPAAKGPLMSKAEVAALLGDHDPMVRDESAPVLMHPTEDKPIFNVFRPTGRS